ncbi:phage portal protein [Malikia spinosa]|uniref:phage portal protein n=1 Tax=Malikia spinosa TaxID=86180 RepID=UPI001FD0D384|nr:phage portal protein [Malikia spinosa]
MIESRLRAGLPPSTWRANTAAFPAFLSKIWRLAISLAYCVPKHHPDDWISTRSSAKKWERIPAYTAWGRRRVLHLHDKERTGQIRGKPVVTSLRSPKSLFKVF